jgi:ABC-2 type transport system ATP-binding protein
MAEPILEIRGLTKSYAGGVLAKVRRVLDGVDLTVFRQEVFGFFGLNGAGKSTTTKIVLGFVEPTSGACSLLGLPVSDERSRAQLGYLPENPVFYDFLDGEELLHYAGELHGLGRVERTRRARKLLARVGLEDEGAKRIGHYSKGMRQRLGLAQALMNDPAFLILDEPLEGLDPLGRQMLKELILEEKRRGASVFLCSHQLLDAEEVCDRCAILHGGRVVACGTLAELTAGHPGLNLEQVFIRLIGVGSAAPSAK